MTAMSYLFAIAMYKGKSFAGISVFGERNRLDFIYTGLHITKDAAPSRPRRGALYV